MFFHEFSIHYNLILHNMVFVWDFILEQTVHKKLKLKLFNENTLNLFQTKFFILNNPRITRLLSVLLFFLSTVRYNFFSTQS